MRRLAAFLCAILMLLAVCLPGVAGQILAILVLVWAVVPVTVFAWMAVLDEEFCFRQPLAIPTFSPRPPPAH